MRLSCATVRVATYFGAVWLGQRSCSVSMQLLQNRLDRGREQGEDGFLLDGFPRTLSQAQALTLFTDVHLAVNLHVRQEARPTLA